MQVVGSALAESARAPSHPTPCEETMQGDPSRSKLCYSNWVAKRAADPVLWAALVSVRPWKGPRKVCADLGVKTALMLSMKSGDSYSEA